MSQDDARSSATGTSGQLAEQTPLACAIPVAPEKTVLPGEL